MLFERKQPVAAKCNSYRDYLHEIRSLSDRAIRAEVAILNRSVGGPVGKLEPLWCIQTCHFFLGYRAGVPDWLARLTPWFRNLGPLMMASHLVLFVASALIARYVSLEAGFIVANGVSIALCITFRLAYAVEATTAKASELVLRNFLVPRTLHPLPYLLRCAYGAASHVLVDLRFLASLTAYLMILVAIPAFLGVWALLFLAGFYIYALMVLSIMKHNFAVPPGILYLSATEGFKDSSLLMIRERVHPARVTTLVRLDRVRLSRLSPSHTYLRSTPPLWADLVWWTAMKLQLRACAVCVVDVTDGRTPHLDSELDEVRRLGRPMMLIGHADSVGVDMSWIPFMMMLESWSARTPLTIYGSAR
jgi:hypothetical protein